MTSRGSTFTSTLSFGLLLRQLRKRAGMTQRDLAAALGYSDSLISSLEKGLRQPDLARVRTHFIPALGLQDDPVMAARFIESAAGARGEQRPAPSPVAIPPAPPSAAARAANPQRLPALPIELVGRTALINQLSNRLLGHGGRLLTLVGPPGVGKTTLALAVATRVQHHYPDGARFIPLATVNDAMLMATTLVAAIAPGDVSNKPPDRRLMELLHQQQLLLLLDNLEQIVGAASLIAALLAECPQVSIVATSRERLHLRAEQRCKVPPLDLVPAIELFVQRAQAVADDFHLIAENRAAIAAICTRLDCLPLALELCAAQVELFAPAQLLAQLRARPLDLLVDGAHDLPPQQRTLRLAIQRSYGLLEQSEQQLFRVLGFFAGGFNLHAVTRFGYPKPVLQTLLHKSLVTYVSSNPQADSERRFFLLETVRQFALEELATANDALSVYHTFLVYILEFAKHANEQQYLPERKTWLEKLSQERHNIQIAFQIALEQNYVELAAELVNHLYWFWYHLGFIEDGRHWNRQILQQGALTLPPVVLAATWATSGKLATIHGDWQSALRDFQASMELYKAAHDEKKIVEMHARCCEALLDTGSVLSASTSIQICVDRVQDWSLTVENCHVAAYVFCVSARIALRTEQTIAARFQFEKSLHCYQQVRDRAGYAFALYSIAQIDMRQGLLEEARQKYIESLAIFLEYDSHLLAGCGYYFLGYLERIAHRYESALHKFLAGLILFGRMGNTGSIVGSVTEIAKVALVKQQYLEACRLFGMADFLRESIGETQWKALPAEYAEYEQHIAQLHQNLDSDLFRKAWQEGHAIATGDLIGYVTNFIAPP